MIRFDRPPAPKLFASDELAEERYLAREFFGRTNRGRSQHRFDWNRSIQLLRRADKELLAYSSCKYVYFESVIASLGGGFNLEHFRSRAQAIGCKGDVSPLHYWWLACEWNNLLAVCQACNIAKAGRFPVTGKRAAPRAAGQALGSEFPLPLDPCTDDPNPHLVFDQVADSMAQTSNVLNLQSSQRGDGLKEAAR